MRLTDGNQRVAGKIRFTIKSETTNGIILVALGNVALLIAKALTWLVVPKVLGVIEYGYFKTFTLYLVYAMFLHFGFPDGMLLIYGGKEYQKIDSVEFRAYSQFFIRFQIIMFVLFVGIFLAVCQGMKCYIFCMVGIDALFVNLATYYKFISQAVMQFKIYTLRNVLQALMQIFLLGVIVLLNQLEILKPNGGFYIICIVFIDAILLVWYMVTYKDLTFGKSDSLKKRLPQIKNIFRVGILLTISYQTTHLIFALDSQMVEVLFDVETYSLYAFAYSITNMVTAVIGAIATVMFPALKQLEIRNSLNKFPTLMAMVSIVVSFSLIAYFPLSFVVKWFLPDYVLALNYLRVIMPGLALSSCINMIIFTYYKVLYQLKKYLFIALGVFVIGGILNCVGYMFFHEPIAFSIASIITLLVWYLWLVGCLVKSFHVTWFKNFVYILVEMFIFYTVNAVWEDSIESMLNYFIAFIITTCLSYKNYIIELLNKCRK